MLQLISNYYGAQEQVIDWEHSVLEEACRKEQTCGPLYIDEHGVAERQVGVLPARGIG